MIVDDSDTDAQLLVRELRRAGYHLFSERVDTAEAMGAALARQQWDVVISDYTMPAFSGRDALQVLHASGLDLPFIIVTGSVDEAVAVKVMKAGAHDCLMRGNLKRLTASIERELREAAVRREHRGAQERLRQSEERFRQMAESITEVFWLTNPQKSEVLYVSPGAEQLWGRPCEQLYARPELWLQAIHPEDRQRIESGLVQQASGNYEREFRIVRPDGSLRWIRDRAFPIKDSSGRVYRVAGIAEDITERKRTEQELRHAKEFSENLIQTANVIILGLDPDGKITIFNETAETITGYTARELQGRNWFETLTPKSRYPEVWAEFQRLAAGGVPKVFENPILTKAGHERHIMWQNNQVRMHGRVVATISFGNDITESRAAGQALKESEERLRMAIDAARMYTWDWNIQSGSVIRSGRQAEVHDSAGGRSGASYEDFIRSVHEQDRQRVEVALSRTVHERVPFRVEFRIIRADGAVRWLSSQAQALCDAAGATVRLIGVTKDITERKQAEEVIERAAFYDLLTELPNRNKLNECLQEAIRADQGQGDLIGLLVMDLNNFKEINDTLGHDSGDSVLKEIAVRLQRVVGAPNLVARLGGDEFAILLPGPITSDDVPAVVQRIQSALHPPILVDGLPVLAEAGIGVAMYPENGLDAEGLLRRADIAMYAAKKAGAGYVIYEPKHDQHSPARLSLLAELRQGIEQDQLILHYQPQIDLKSGRVCGAEALVRWHHPQRGLVPPDVFIGPAEHTGLIHPLTEWVMVTAARQCASWQKEGLRIPLAINLSARSLFDPLLPDRIITVLRNSDVAPEMFNVEITESAIMADPVRARQILLRIHEIGVRISIDDFGIGYSSLGSLRKLPVNRLKVDKSFVINMAHDEGDAAIVRSTIDLAHNLGVEVVAEGVEDKETYNQLLKLNCDRAQGYLISKPLSTLGFSAWLRESTWRH
ncbi:MAG TPA: EAL domain-containing protein [Steroidobacteraceae bacterium]